MALGSDWAQEVKASLSLMKRRNVPSSKMEARRKGWCVCKFGGQGKEATEERSSAVSQEVQRCLLRSKVEYWGRRSQKAMNVCNNHHGTERGHGPDKD